MHLLERTHLVTAILATGTRCWQHLRATGTHLDCMATGTQLDCMATGTWWLHLCHLASWRLELCAWDSSWLHLELILDYILATGSHLGLHILATGSHLDCVLALNKLYCDLLELIVTETCRRLELILTASWRPELTLTAASTGTNSSYDCNLGNWDSCWQHLRATGTHLDCIFGTHLDCMATGTQPQRLELLTEN